MYILTALAQSKRVSSLVIEKWLPQTDPDSTYTTQTHRCLVAQAPRSAGVAAVRWLIVMLAMLVGTNLSSADIPAVPTGLKLAARGETALTIEWMPSADGAGIPAALYHVYVNGTLAKTVSVANAMIGDLKPVTNYTLTVKAANAEGGTSAASAPLNATTMQDGTPPTVPGGVTGTATDHTVTLSWNGSTDAVGVSGYDVVRENDVVGRATLTTFTDSGVLAGRTYGYTVRAFDAAGNRSEASTALYIATRPDVTAPSIPANLRVTAKTARTVSLAWDASTDDNLTIAEYRVTFGTQFLSAIYQNSVVINDLVPGTAYTFTVQAQDRAGNRSAASAPVSATTTADTTPPSTPAVPKLESTGLANVYLSWPPTADNVGVAFYEIHRNGTKVASRDSYYYDGKVTWWDTGLSARVAYSYALKAIDFAGNASALGPALSVTLPGDVTPPTPPGQVTASAVTDVGFKLTWYVAQDESGGSGMDGYEVWIDGAKHQSLIGTEATIAGLTPLRSYTVVVKARDKAGNIATSPGLLVTTLQEAIPPTVPAGLTAASVTAKSVTLTWTAASDNSAVAGYELLRGNVVVGQTAALTLTDDGLAANATYSYSVRAFDAHGNRSAASTAVSARTSTDTTVPTAPGGLTVTGRTESQVSLSWTAGTDNVRLSHYVILRGISEIGQSTGLTFTETGLDANTSYTYTVKSVDGGNNRSPASAAVTTTTLPDAVAPLVPGKPYATAIVPTSVTLAWTPSTDNVRVSAYEVYRNGTLISQPATNAYTDINLTPGSTVVYTLKAKDPSGNVSALSGSLSITLPLDTVKPAMPTNFMLSRRGDTSVDLSWNGSADVGSRVVSYEIVAGTTVVATTASSWTTVTGLKPATAYSYIVHAVDVAGNRSDPSLSLAFKTNTDSTVPTVPTGLAAGTLAFQAVPLTWVAASDNTAVTAYEISRDSVAIARLGAVTAFSDTTVKPGVSYNYAVRAIDGAGNMSAYCANLRVTTPTDTVAPTAPTTLTVTDRQADRITLTWSGASDNVAVAKYAVLRGTSQVALATGTTYTDTGLAANTAYTYSVKAVDFGNNQSPASVAVSATTLADTQAPGTPSVPSLSSSTSTTANLAWPAASDNVGVSAYEVYRNGVLAITTAATYWSDTNQVPGSTLSYTLKARDAVGNVSAAGPALSVTLPGDTQKPTPPAELELTTRSDTSLVLKWVASTDVGSRVVSYEVLSGSTVVATVTAASATVTNLVAGSVYTFTVRAVDAAGNRSDASLPLVVRTNTDSTKPTVPTISAGTPTLQSVPLSWTAATDNAAVTGYEVSRNSVAIARLAAVLTYTDTGVVPGTTYYYAVRSIDAAGNMSAWSAAISARTLADTVLPTAPGTPTVTAQTMSTVSLAWTPGSDNVAVASYAILRGGSQIGSTTATTYTDTNLSAGTTYTYTVRTVDVANNQSPVSPGVNATTLPDSVAPSIPDKPSATTILTTSLTLGWSPASDNVAVTGYEVYRGGVLVRTVTTNTFGDSGLAPGAVLSYALKARDGAGNVSALGPALSVTMPGDTQKPTAPASFTLSGRTDTTLSFTWYASTDVGSSVASYEVVSGTTVVATSTTLSGTVTGLIPATAYTFTVRAVDAAGNRSDASLPLAVRTNVDSSAPSAPTIPVIGALTLTEAPLTWTASTDAVGVVGYEIARDFVAYAQVGMVTAYTDTGIKPGSAYYYQVRAFDAAGNKSAWSPYRYVTMLSDTQAPSTPASLAVTATTPGSVSLSWAAASDNVGIAGYHVLRNGTQVGAPTGTTYTDTGLSAGTTYSYTVRSVDLSSRTSAVSTAVSATTLADTSAPSAPGQPSVSNLTAVSLSLAWSPATDNVGISLYEIHRNGSLLTTVTTNSFSDAGVTPGATLTYTVRAKDGAGNFSAFSASTSVTAPADTNPPTTPGNLVLSTRYDTRLSLSWAASTDAESRVASYELLSGATVLASAPSTSFTLTGLMTGTSYTISIRAVDAAGNRSPASLPLTVSTDTDSTVPTVPTGITIGTLGVKSVPVSWTAASDNVGVVGYEIGRQWVPIARVGVVTSYTDTGADPGAGYYYSVRAFDAAGNTSAWSDAKVVSIPADTVVPTAPTALTVGTRTASTVALSWTAASDNVRVAHYQVLRNGTPVGTVSGTAYVDNGLAANTAFSYTVKAVDQNSNQSAVSNAVSASTLVDTQAPTFVGSLVLGGVQYTSVSFSWPVALDNGLIAHYEVTRNGAVLATSPSPSFTDNTVVPGTTYTYSVKAKDASGNVSPASANLVVTTLADTVAPAAPQWVRLYSPITGTSVPVQWTGSSDNGSGVVSYDIYANGVKVATTTSSSVILTLATGSPHLLSVVARDAAGLASAFSDTLSVTTGTNDSVGPAAPTGVVVSNVTAGSLRVSWTQSAEAVAYEVIRSGQFVGRTNGTSLDDSAVIPSRSYTYLVYAIDAAGNRSTNSVGQTVATPADSTKPTAPLTLTAHLLTPVATQLTWPAASDNVRVAGYNVYRNGGFVAQVSTPGYTDPYRLSGARLTFSVMTVDTAGNLSPASPTAEVQMPTDVTAPSIPGTPLVTGVTTRSASLAWSGSTDSFSTQISYVVFRDGSEIATTSQPYYSDTTRIPGSTASYTIKAADIVGNRSAASGAVSATTLADTVAPPAPTGVYFSSRSANSLTLGWTGSTDAESAIARYEVVSGATVLGSGASTSLAVTNLVPSTSYTLAVVAVDVAGNRSAPSATITAITGADATAPTAPTGLVAGAITETSIAVSWTAASDSSGVSVYEIARASLVVGRVTGTSFLDTGLKPNTANMYQVRALDPAGNASAWSAYINPVTKPDTVVPTTPAGLAVTSTSVNRVVLSWTAASDNLGLAGYRIRRNGVQVGETSATTFTDTTVVGSTTYGYSIVAVDLAGNLSATTSVVNATTTADTIAPSVPGQVYATSVGYTSLSLAWAASTDLVGVSAYELLRDGIVVGSTVGATYTLSSLPAGTSSVYTVRARDVAGNVSATSAPATIATLADTKAPTVPMGPYLSNRGDLTVTVTWAAATDAESGLAGYEILNGTTVVATTPSTSGTINGLSASTSYTVTVRAYDKAGNRSQASPPFTFHTATDATAPTVPAAFVASNVTMTGLTLAWSASTDNIAVASYEVYRDTASIARVTATTFSETALTPGTAYRYWFRAVDAAGNASGWTAVLNVSTTADTVLPTVPTNLAVTFASENSVGLSWSAASDNVAIKRYLIRRNAVDVGEATGTTFSDTSVASATTYSYTVLAEDTAGNRSAVSSAVSATTGADTQAPSVPGQPYATTIAYNSLSLTWAAASDNVRVATYEILRNGAVIGTSTTTTFVASGLTAGTSSSYSIRAKDAAGNTSAASATATIATRADTTAPSAPTGLALSARYDTSLALTWSAGVDSESGMAGYEVLRGTTVVATAAGNVGSATVTGLSPATSYVFTVRGFDAAGNRSATSPALTVMTGTDATPPTVPTLFAASNLSMTGLTLTWTASTDNAAVSAYEVFRDTLSIALVTTGTTYVDSGLRPGTALRYWVRARDPSGNASAWTPVLNVTPLFDTVLPSTPTAVQVTSFTENRVSLSWTASTDNIGIKRYVIRRDGSEVGESTTTTFSDTTVNPATLHSFVVLAEDIAGNRSPASTAVTTTTAADTQAPSAPGQPLASALGYTSVTLSWAPASDNVRIHRYEVLRNGTSLALTAGSSFAVGSLVPGTASTFTIRAKDAAGNTSVASAATTVTTLTDGIAPTAPTGLMLSARADASLSLTWTAGADAESGIVRYEVLRGTTVVATSPSTSATVATLSPTTAYTFTVRAVDAAGKQSATSPSLTAITAVDNTPPAVPTGFVAGAVTKTSAEFAWTATSDNVATTFYEISRQSAVVGRSPTATFNEAELKPGTAHAFAVRAWDAAGNVSTWSSPYSLNTQTDSVAPSTPTGLSAVVLAPDRVSLSWNASTDDVAMGSYRVQVKHPNNGYYSFLGDVTGTTYSAVKLKANANYSFQVQAVDRAGNESAPAEVTIATTGDTLAPSVPGQPVVIMRTPSTITLAWSPSTDNVLVASYEIFRNGTRMATVTPSYSGNEPTPQGVDTLLAPGTTYTYAIRAVDTSGNASALSPTTTGATTVDLLPPAPPTNLTLVGRTARSISLSWTASQDAAGGSGVTAYDIRIGGTVRATVPATQTTGTVTGLSAATSYVVTVTARDAGGLSSLPSLPLTTITQPDASDFAPTDLVDTEVTATTATLVWKPSPLTRVTGYEILRIDRVSQYSPTVAVVVGTTAASVNRFTLTGLRPYTLTYYVVRSMDGSGNRSNPSNERTVLTLRDTTAPTVPTGLTVTGKTAGTISLSWSPSSDDYRVDFYQVFVTKPDATPAGHSEVTGTTAVVRELAPGITYSLSVVAYDPFNNKSGASAVVTATTDADTLPPSAPTRLRTTYVATSYVTLTWDASTDNVGVVGYDVFRGGVKVASLGNSGLHLQDVGLTQGTAYTYTVKARDAVGLISPASNTVNVTTRSDTVAPMVPANLRQTSKTDSSVGLEWDAAGDDADGTGVAGYDLAKDGVVVANVVVRSATVTALIPLTSYTFAVRAVDRSGNRSAWSVAQTVITTEDRTPPSTPTQLVAGSATRTSIALSWAASSDNVGVMGYEVLRDDQTLIATQTGRLYTDTALRPGTTYSYTVRAFDAVGNRSASSAVAIITTASDSNPPAVPTNLRVVSTTRAQVVLAWNAATDAETTIAGYQLRRLAAGTEDETLLGPTTALTWTDIALPADATFLYSVASIDRGGLRSAWSAPVSAMTNAKPTIATAASTTPQPVIGATATLTVLGADDAGEAPLTYTWATVGTVPSPVLFPVQGTNAAKTTTVRFTRAGSYTLRATIRDAAGATVTSDIVALPVTATPTTVTVEPSATSIPTGTTLTFAATVRDQFGLPLSPQPAVTWSAVGGTINPTTGAFVSTAAGAAAITATTTGLPPTIAAATVYSGTNRPPTVASSASTTIGSDLVTVALKALGADDAGEAALTYRWLCIAAPSGANVTITPTGPTNAAKNAQTVLSVPGFYRFRCVIADVAGATISSEVGLQFIGDQPPTITTLPSATMVAGSPRDVQLTVAASDDGGEPNLTYRWSLVTPAPGQAVFATSNGANAGKQQQVRVDRAGPYTFEVVTTDKKAGAVQARASVTVNAVPTALQISPVVASVAAGGTVDLTTITVDQFGEAMTSAGTVVWQPTPGGTIASGRFTAGTTAGDFPLGASIGTVWGQALVNVVGVVPITIDAGSLTGSKVVKSGSIDTHYSSKARVLFHLQRPATDTTTLTLYDNGQKIEELPGGLVSFSRDISEGEHRLVAVRSGSPAPAGDIGTRLVIDRTPPVVDIEIFPAMGSADQALITAAGELLLNGNPETGTWGNQTVRTRDRIPAFSYSRIVGSTEAESVLVIDPSIVPASVRVQLVSDTAAAMLPCPSRPASADDRAEFRWNLPASLPDDDYRIGWTATDLAGNTATELNASIRVRVRRAAPILQFQDKAKSSVRIGVEGNQLAFLPGLTLKSTTMPSTVVPPARCFADGTTPAPLRPSVRQGYQVGDVPRWTLPAPVTISGQVAVRGQDRYGNYSPSVVFTCIDGYKEQSGIYESFNNSLNYSGSTPTHADIEQWSTSEWLILPWEEWPLVRSFHPYGDNRVSITIDGWVSYYFNNYRQFGYTNPYPIVTDARITGQYCDPSRSQFPILTHAGVDTTLRTPGWYGHRDEFSKPSTNLGTTVYDARRVLHQTPDPNRPGSYLPGGWYSYEDSTSSMTFRGYVPPKDTTVPAIRGLSPMVAANLSASTPISDYYVLQVPVKPLSDQDSGGLPYVYGRVIDIPPSWAVGTSAHMVEIREPGLAQVITALVSPLTITAEAYAGPKGGQRIAMSGSTVAAYGAGPSGVAFTIPIARTGSQALTEPGAIDIAYACAGGQPRVTRYGDPELAWKNDGDGWLRSVRIENDVLQYSGHQTLRIKGGFTDRGFTVGNFVPTGEYIRIHQAPVSFDGVPGGMVSVHGAAQLPAERDPTKITIIAYRLIPDPVEPDRLQTLEVDLDVGEQVPRTVLDVDIRCGAIAGSDSDPIARPENGDHFGAIGNVPAGPSHRMRASLMTARFVINPIALWQLEDRKFTIHINDGDKGLSDPDCWLDVQLPHLTLAEARAKVAALTLEWGLEPHAFLLQSDEGIFRKFATLAKVPVPATNAVRVLGGQVHTTPESALLGGSTGTFSYTISGALLDELGIGPSMGLVTVTERTFEVEPAVEANGRFPKAPLGSPSLYGNSAWVTPLKAETEPLLPPLRPSTLPAEALPNNAHPYGRNARFAVVDSQYDDLSRAIAPALVTAWKDDRTFAVSGQLPGTTVLQVRPVFTDGTVASVGTAAESLMEIPIVVEMPIIATPGLYQLHAARTNASLRASWTPGGGTTEPLQYDTPTETEDGSESVWWRLPPSWQWINGVSGTGGFQLTPWAAETTNTKDLDGLFDLAMHQLAQIVPTGTEAGPGSEAALEVWHAPLSAPDSQFKIPVTDVDPNQAKYRLSIERLRKVLLWGAPGTDETIRQRLAVEAMPQNIWLRARHLARAVANGTRSYATPRNDLFSDELRKLMECRALTLTDHAALQRLKRYFSLTWDYRVETAALPPTRNLGAWYEADNLPMMGADAKVEAGFWDYVWNPLTGSMGIMFKTAITPEWHIGNNLSREVINWMLLERRNAAEEIIARSRRTNQPGQAGWPFVISHNSVNIPLEVISDGTATKCFRIPLSYLEPATNPLAPAGSSQIKGWGNQVVALPSSTRMSENASSGLVITLWHQRTPETEFGYNTWRVVGKNEAAAVAMRCLHECNLLAKLLQGQAAEDAELSMRNGSPVSYFAYIIGDALFSWGSIYACITGTDFITGTGLRAEQYAMHAGMVLLTGLPVIGGVVKKLVGTVVKKGFIGTGVKAQADVLMTLKGNITPPLNQTINVPVPVRSTVDELAVGGKSLGVDTMTPGKVGLKFADDAVKALAGAVTREAAEQTAQRFLMHTGFARVGPGVVERAGAQAPIASVFYGLANAAKRPLPHPSLAKLADIRGSGQLLERVNDDALRARIANAFAHDRAKADRLVTALCGKPECFPAGTLVLMADGSAKAIDQVEVGDVVRTRSDRDDTAPVVTGMVTRTFARRVPGLIAVTLGQSSGALNMVLRSTPDHPVWVSGYGWSEAEGLSPGQSLISDQPQAPWMVRDLVQEPAAAEGVLVYNFEVEGTHTYFVGGSVNPTGPPAGWAWVHNTCKTADVLEKTIKNQADDVGEILSPVDLIDRVSTNVTALAARSTKLISFFQDIATQATRNPESKMLVLGKYAQDGKSYVKVAAHFKATYFKVENWGTVTKGLSVSETWKINEAFLKQQLQLGKQIILSHNPGTATGFYRQEIDFLRALGYRFVQDGWVWRAIK